MQGFECGECPLGMVGDGINCTDIDEVNIDRIKCSRAVLNRVSKVISDLLCFCITSLGDWFKVLAPLFQPVRSETKTNRGSRVHIFPRFVSATCNYFEFSLVYWIVSVLFDWSK